MSHIWMSHVYTHEWVMSLTFKGVMFYTWKGRVAHVIRWSGTIFYSLVYVNPRIGFNGLQYLYSVISVVDKRLPGNTKKLTLVRSWTARVQLVYSWVTYTCRAYATRVDVAICCGEWVVCCIWVSHVPRMNQSCDTYECVVCCMWMSSVLHMNA